MSDEPDACWVCGSTASVFRFECPECLRRWEDMLCRELRERLFPVTTAKPLE